MKEELLKYLPDPNTVKGGMAAIVETIQAEAPELVKEILRWCFISSFVCWIMTNAAIVFFVIYLYRKYIKGRNTIMQQWEDSSFGPILLVEHLVYGILAFVGFIWLLPPSGAWNWIKIAVAPRLFMLEYITELLK